MFYLRFCRKFVFLLFLVHTLLPAKGQEKNSFIQALAQKAVELDPSFLTGRLTDIQQQQSWSKKIDIGDFSILGIGEQSHGTHEFFKARISLIRLLVKQQPVTKIGLEAPMAEVENLNTYLLSDSGDLKMILKSFQLYSYECEEFVDLVETVKMINAQQGKKISFFGFDFQSPYQVLNNLKRYGKNHELAQTVDALVSDYTQLNAYVSQHAISPDDFRSLDSLSQLVIKPLETNAKSSRIKDGFLEKNLIQYQQFLSLNDPEKNRADVQVMSQMRDSLMAQNVLREYSSGQKMILLAHNAHVQKTADAYSRTMGQFLLQAIGAMQYRCIGLTTSRGFFTAYNQQQQKITATNSVSPPDSDAFESYFSKIAKPIFFLPTSGMTALNPDSRPDKYRLLPYGVPKNQFIRGNLLQAFDYIIHIENTTGNKSFYLH